MTLRVVGAGLGRTGTHSLKVALEELLGGPCYHMMEVFGRPDDIAIWHRAMLGELPDWDELFDGYRATVDWPAAAFWPELRAAFPDALVLLSTRDADAWWESANRTIFEMMRRPPAPEAPPDAVAQLEMVKSMVKEKFGADINDESASKAAFERKNAEVRAAVPAEQLLEWHPGDGWAPICAALGLPVPDEPFPHVNTTDDFRAFAGFDSPSPAG